MLKYLPTVVAVLSAVATTATPDLQHAVAQNPTAVVVLSSLVAVLTHLLPSPLKKD